MRVHYSLFLAAAILLMPSCTVSDPAEKGDIAPIELSVAQASELMDKEKLQLLDVRTSEEVSEGSIAGARNLNISDWEDFQNGISELDKEQPIMVFCRSGGRSHKAAMYLVENGFKQVYDVKGGMIAWEKEGLDITRN